MKTLTLAAAFISFAFIGSVVAQTPPEVVVTAARPVTEVGKMPGGTPIVAVSLSYTVSAKGLDLSSQDGKAKFEKAVADAAQKACESLHNQFPETNPSPHDCMEQARDKAMPKVRELEAKAAAK